ncbi:MAG: hypothetical protein OXN83_05025 [Oligoflexia bacterium]|nr:hypothetical protein [Oligoflexia bacterium]
MIKVKSVIKLHIAIIFLCFFTVCSKDDQQQEQVSGQESAKTTDDSFTEGGEKIQKNSSFKPECRGEDSLNRIYSSIICEIGEPVCGTQHGSDELKAYCIDDNDNIMGPASCLLEKDGLPLIGMERLSDAIFCSPL